VPRFFGTPESGKGLYAQRLALFDETAALESTGVLGDGDECRGEVSPRHGGARLTEQAELLWARFG
jgi:hypothetical protein